MQKSERDRDATPPQAVKPSLAAPYRVRNGRGVSSYHSSICCQAWLNGFGRITPV